jgi:hypothetical protein
MTPWAKASVILSAIGAGVALVGRPWVTHGDVAEAASKVEARLEAHIAEERKERQQEAGRLEERINEVGRDVKDILKLLGAARR